MSLQPAIIEFGTGIDFIHEFFRIDSTLKHSTKASYIIKFV